ncbi:eukaryotic translation initiation factor 5 [Martensiomyces pterosporus]|nr:eukaryotic translation initiation factor 5 [Martensiomyces pterosporus]
MATLNIRRDVKDSFYRYKMPRLQSKIEGKGNGIKTVLPNISEVSRALSRPPAYPTKYFGNELGAQVKIEEKNDRYIVNGAHDVSKLQDLLYGFIDRFVLCGNCKNPETDLIISKDGSIIRQCMACGQRSDVDMRHRLATYIIKNPPPKVKKGGQHASAGGSQGAGAGGQENGHDGESGGEGGDPTEELDRLAKEAAQLDINDEDDDWEVDMDVSAEAVARRQKALAGGFTQDHDDDDHEGGGDDPYDQLGDFIMSEKPATDREVYEKAKELHLGKKHRALVVVVQCVFANPQSAVKDIAKHSTLLQSFGDSDKHQRAIIGGFERLIADNLEALLPKTPMIFKALFDEDIVEEEAFLEWGKKPSKKYVEKDVAKRIHKSAEPFLQWLEEADEEESDSDDE